MWLKPIIFALFPGTACLYEQNGVIGRLEHWKAVEKKNHVIGWIPGRDSGVLFFTGVSPS